jgi:peroxiredoxin
MKMILNLLTVSLFVLALAAPLPAAAPPAVGQAAPDFTLTGSDGKDVKLSALKGKFVVLEWINPDCPFVQRHYQAGTMKGLADRYRDQGVVWLAINSTHYMGPDNNRQWAAKYSLPYAILDDRAGQVGRLYGARTTPHMYIIDKTGRLVYAGAIDSDAAGSEAKPVNYVAQALDELLAGKAVSMAETKPYGCSVKFAK